MLSPAESPVELQVFDYNLRAGCTDTQIYCDHQFTIRVCIQNIQHVYVIKRSYSAFCYFDALLRRKYPRSKLPTLPLLGKDQNQYQKKGLMLAGGGSAASGQQQPESFIKAAVGDLRSSMAALENGSANDSLSGGRESAGRRSIRRIDNTEIIQHKKVPLTIYLQQLLAIPEILLSETLLAFLDEESAEGEILDERQQAMLTPIDLLIFDEVPVQKRVLRQHPVSLNVEEGFVIVWKFHTRNHDIGFSVQFNKADCLAYQRVNSHVKPVTGLFEAPAKGQVTIVFDNAYSRMHTKYLSYWIRVVEAAEYEAAKEMAVFKAKQRRAMQEQQSMLQKCLAKLSKDLISSSGVKFTVNSSENTEERFRTMSTWEGELAQLRDEKKSLAHALEESIRALEVERNAYADSIGRLESTSAIKDAAEDDLQAVRLELELLRQQTADEREQHAGAIEELQASRDRALDAIDLARREMAKAKALKDQTELLEATSALLATEREEKVRLLEQSARLKAEKKQLVAYAKQSKADIEKMTHEMQMLAAEGDKLRDELSMAVDRRLSRDARSSSSEAPSRMLNPVVAPAPASSLMSLMGSTSGIFGPTCPGPAPASNHIAGTGYEHTFNFGF